MSREREAGADALAASAIAAERIEPIPETSDAERVVADVLAIGAPAAVAKRVRDSVPLWFHTFALAPGVYTPGIARDHGYRLAVLGADRLRGAACFGPTPEIRSAPCESFPRPRRCAERRS